MRLFLFIFLIILVSCSDDSFKKVESLDGFRILGVYSSTPEVAPGAAATLQLVVSDVKGAGRAINGTTESCIDPGIAFGAKVNCDHDPLKVSGTYTIDPNTESDVTAANLYTGLADDVVNVTIPNTILTGRSARDQFNGVGYITIFRFTVDGKNVAAFKRIVATNRGSLNQNPSGSSILLNGAPISAAPEKGAKLVATNSAPETYQVITIDGVTETRTEDYQVAWYVTQGKFDKPKSKISETVEYQGSAPSTSSLLMVIVRDERGGLEVVKEIFP